MSKTLIRVALAAVVVNRDGYRATVPPKVPFHYEEHEVRSIEKFDPNMIREADDTEVRGAMKFEDLKGRKKSAKRVTETESTRVTETANSRVTESAKTKAAEGVNLASTHTREELEPMNKTELTAIAAAANGDVELPANATKADIIKAILMAEGVEEDDAL